MTRAERRVLIDTTILGVLLTFAAAILDYTDMLRPFESLLYDFRARYCQRFNKPPTNKLMHIDIDDRSLEVIGHWPWPRSRMAEIIDELRIAGLKALATDIIYSEPDPYDVEKEEVEKAILDRTKADGANEENHATSRAAKSPVKVTLDFMDQDEMLADSIKRFGHVIVPVSLNLNSAPNNTEIYRVMLNALMENITLDRVQLNKLLVAKGYGLALADRTVQQYMVGARSEAMYELIARNIKSTGPDIEKLRKIILPKLDATLTGSAHLRILREQLERYLAVQSLRRFSRPLEPGLPPIIFTRDEQATLRILGEAAASTGYVDYIRGSEGIIRHIPIWANHRDFLFPQMGFSLACHMLGVDLKDVRLEKDRVILPRPGGQDVVIPVHMAKTHRGTHGMYIDIPWFGKPVDQGWETMYDYKRHEIPAQHMGISYVWEAVAMRRRIAQNNANVDRAIDFFIKESGITELADFARQNPPGDINNPQSRTKIILKMYDFLATAGYFPWLEEVDPGKLTDEKEAAMYRSYAALKETMAQNVVIKKDLDSRRADFKRQLEGKAALIGYIAVGTVADVVPTPIQAQCPGVVAHGVIFNAIMTNEFWRRAPAWVTVLFTIILGLGTTAVSATLTAKRAFFATTILAVGYLLLNGVYLFDYHNLIVGVAGPIAATMAVWGGCTLARYILETAARAAVEQRFSARVDPALVSYVLEHDTARFDGQVKELTVVFTDLAGFTSLSERLKEATVPLLNKYMSRMIPLIRKHNGYVNKLLGDGIMFFFGSPRDNAAHPIDAVVTVMEMLAEMGPLNEELAADKMPSLSLRAGICTGDMVVGDAGSEEHYSDYTVLGDNVNLSSRLEAANKAFGTRILLNDRASELIIDRVLLRPIGRIQVKGKSHGVMTFEALALLDQATDEQKKLTELTAAFVAAFVAGEFQKCIDALDVFEHEISNSRLTTLYRRLCEQYLATPPEKDFDGQIVLEEK